MLKTVAQEISQHLKIDTPSPNERGHYPFSFNNNLNVSILSQDPDIILASPIDTNIDSDSEPKVANTLKWHLARIKDHDDILSFDPDTNQLFLFKQLPPSKLAEKPIHQHLEDFLNNLEYWNSAAQNDASPPSGMLPL